MGGEGGVGLREGVIAFAAQSAQVENLLITEQELGSHIAAMPEEEGRSRQCTRGNPAPHKPLATPLQLHLDQSQDQSQTLRGPGPISSG